MYQDPLKRIRFKISILGLLQMPESKGSPSQDGAKKVNLVTEYSPKIGDVIYVHWPPSTGHFMVSSTAKIFLPLSGGVI